MTTQESKNQNLLLSFVLVVFGMIMLSYAAVPLYNIFCKATGTGGEVRQSEKGASYVGNRSIEVIFDSNVDKKLPWDFKPEQRKINIRTGENALVFYSAYNYSNQDIVGTAVYNITPHKAAKYFFKIQCFCFEEQLLKAKERVSMPVSFYIDPEIEKDINLQDIKTITLSYNFFKVNQENKNEQS